MARLIAFGLFMSLCVTSWSADPRISQLRAQLSAAENAGDKPAIIELSRRIVAMAPNDFAAWEILARTQLEIEGNLDT